MKRMTLINWRRTRVLLGVLATLLTLAVFAPQLSAPTTHSAAPISIAANVYTNYALIAIPFKADDTQWAVKPNKHDPRGKRILTRDSFTSLPVDNHVISDFSPRPKQIGSLTNTGSDLHQVYLLLDIPPPAL